MLTQATSRLPASSWRLSSRRSALQQGRPICSTVSAKPRLRTTVKPGVYARVRQLHETMWEREVYSGQLPSLVLFYTDYSGDNFDKSSPEELSFLALTSLIDNEDAFKRHTRINASCMVDDWYGGKHKEYGIDPREPTFLLFKDGQPVEGSRRAAAWFFEESFIERMRDYLIEQGIFNSNEGTMMIGDTIKNMQLDTRGMLFALCKDSDGSWRSSRLDLNRYLANNDGQIEVANPLSRPGNFMASCVGVELSNGCLTGDARRSRYADLLEPFSLDITKLVENVDGTLKFKE